METLLNKIKKVIEIEKGKEVVVMYSGGMDSSLLIVSLQKLNYKPIPVFFIPVVLLNNALSPIPVF
jgi:tRNA(Ile)-lysidine synthase TilS/MesJ